MENHEVKQLVAEVAAKEKRAFRISMALSVIALLLGGAWLLFSYWNVIKMEKKRDDAKNQAEAYQKQVEDAKEELDNKRKEITNLQKQVLSADQQPCTIPLKEDPSKKSVGWAYYGFDNGNGTWSDKYFEKVSGDPNSPPQVGDKITSQAMMNLRETFRTYNPDGVWSNPQIIGLIKRGQSFTVLKVTTLINNNLYWVELSRNK